MYHTPWYSTNILLINDKSYKNRGSFKVHEKCWRTTQIIGKSIIIWGSCKIRSVNKQEENGLNIKGVTDALGNPQIFNALIKSSNI